MACLESPPGKFNDFKWDILQRILCATQDAASSGGAGLFGSGDPNGVVNSTVAGQFYRNTDTNSLWQSTAIGNSSWVQVT